jgi:hypothetical protein
MPMKSSILLAAAAFSLSAGFACAQSLADNPPKTTIICLDVAGRNLPAQCQTQASRLDAREDICLCPGAAQRVTIAVCPPGVHEPAESAALERARLKAVSHGSLMGATYKGRPICRAPRNALNP